MAVFGEKVLGYPLRTESRKKDVEAKAIPGLYVGHAASTSTALLLTEIGVRRVRGLARLTEEEQWSYKPTEYRI
eukprot:5634172-Amphidinium_carterae.1